MRTTMPEDRILRAAFWTDQRVGMLAAQERLAFVYLWALADADGIAPVGDWTTFARACGWDAGQGAEAIVRRMLARLAHVGLVALYDHEGSPWVWVPGLPVHQPRQGNFRPSRDVERPAPPVDAVRAVLTQRIGHEADDDACLAASPRSYGRAGRSAGLPPSKDVGGVWDEWRKRQASPNACRLSAAKHTICGALEHASAADLVALVRYAYEADEPGPRFWRGANDQRRTYLGLDNLFRRSKLAARLQAAVAWRDRPTRGEGKDGAVDLGPFASRAKVAEAQSTIGRWSKEEQ